MGIGIAASSYIKTSVAITLTATPKRRVFSKTDLKV
jgi:hypothetical protein